MDLKRYWLEFDVAPDDWSSPRSRLRAGCGVTGSSREDCILLIRERVLRGSELPRITKCVENVDVSTLDPRHVIPNMGIPSKPGIWFPQGYD